jgi:hypothetical protein
MTKSVMADDGAAFTAFAVFVVISNYQIKEITKKVRY